ncbi:MAG TPA: JAB domain-containing protein [Mesotoga infera]|uniref:JAB domain-containing protein n=1 Tax=Mesotoga infera TaxID=1236046 RepID=A0A7C1GZN1_9BACT|nr:JAB domain-containing protein [Mesotoga infera]
MIKAIELQIVREYLNDLSTVQSGTLLKELNQKTETGCIVKSLLDLMNTLYPDYMRSQIHHNRAERPESLYWACHDMIALDQEMMKVVSLSTKLNIVGIDLVSLGILDSCICHPREVFRPAIMRSAAGIVLVHNHPCGDPSPSEEDKTTTNAIREAGKILGIRLVDHVILAKGSLYSFTDERIIDMLAIEETISVKESDINL